MVDSIITKLTRECCRYTTSHVHCGHTTLEKS